MSSFLRILIAIALPLIVFQTYNIYLIPPLTFSGILYYINTVTLVYLLILTARHFLIIYLAALEDIRRERRVDTGIQPKVSIIVPAFNEDVVIASSIKRLKEIDYPDYEVIIVDDGSTDLTFQKSMEAVANDSRFFVTRKQNAGKAQALNFGINLAHGDFVFCMDADSHLLPHAIAAGIRNFTHDKVGAVAGSVTILNQHKVVTSFQTMEYLVGLNFFKSAQSFMGAVTIVPGPSGLFRKSAIIEVGGYESDTFAEDCDLTLKLLMNKYEIVYEPDMEVQTEAPEDWISLIKQRYRWSRGIVQAIKKHMKKLLNPIKEPTSFMVELYMLTEALILPFCNFTLALVVIIYGAVTKDIHLFSLWLFQLTFLEMAVIVFILYDMRCSLRMIPYAFISRFTYSFFLDIVKILSTLEDFFGIKMDWGKLKRTGSSS